MVMYSRSASDKYTGIIEKTGSQNASAFQRSINGTLFSGEFTIVIQGIATTVVLRI